MKQIFINTIKEMVDHKTFFNASSDFWGSTFDRIESGRLEGIDPTFITVYRTVKAMTNLQSSYRLSREEEYIQERRILLSAIEARLDGKCVHVLCASMAQVRQMEENFFTLIGKLKPILNSRDSNVALLHRGSIAFHVAQGLSGKGFEWGVGHVHGADIKDAVYVMPSVVFQHYGPLLNQYKKHSKLIDATDYVRRLELAIDTGERYAKKQADLRQENSKVTS